MMRSFTLIIGKLTLVSIGQHPLCLISCLIFKVFPTLGSSKETVDCKWQIGQTWKTKWKHTQGMAWRASWPQVWMISIYWITDHPPCSSSSGSLLINFSYSEKKTPLSVKDEPGVSVTPKAEPIPGAPVTPKEAEDGKKVEYDNMW